VLTSRVVVWPGVVRSLLVSLCVCLAVLGLSACSARQLLVQGIAAELATQGQAPEDDLQLAREASAFYLKLSESVLREAPGHLPLAEAVAAGFTQYAYAFVAADADRLDARDARMAHTLRQRAARLYRRAHQHAMHALEQRQPGFRRALEARSPTEWPQPAPDMVALVYWGAASWGGWISLSKDDPDVVADLPLANRLAALAYDRLPSYGDGALASLMGTFEAARPGGSVARATAYFDHGIALGGGRNAGAFMAKAEGIALPAGDRAGFEALLRQALRASEARRDLQNEAMRERALWLLESLDDLF
jgi:TRAP transporter T-component